MAADARVSVVIPVRDAARYLDAALASVAAQTHRPHEVIVVDDGSRDDSAQVAERRGARVERQPARGAAAARNRGLELATGDLLAFLDADDLWPADKLERQVAILERHAEVDLLFGQVRQFSTPTPDQDAEAPQPGILFGALLARRTAFDRVGPLSTQWRVGELMEWLLRAREVGLRELVDGDVVLYRRVHDRNVSRDHDLRVDHARILRAALVRRRGRGG